MASILRSSKFVRYIAGFARNVVSGTPRDVDGSFVNSIQYPCTCGTLTSSLATQASQYESQNLERSLKRIDQDVRKSGRISRRDIEDVLEEIRNSRSPTSSQSLLVIRCCGNLVPEELPETRTRLVQEIWNTLNKLKVPMDVSHYNALLRVYLENEHSFSPVEFLAELEKKGIEPNRVTYQRLIARYCQEGDIEGATRILEFMREKQLPVNEIVFNALIHGHSQSGDMESARGILSVMNQAGLEPSADTYTTLLCGYAKVGDLETMQKLFEECETKEIYLLDKDYLDVIYSLAVNAHSELIPTVLGKIRKSVGFYQDAINICLRMISKGLEDAALPVLRIIPKPTRADGSFGNSGTFFIRHMVKAERPVEKIVEICSILQEENLFDNPLTYATEISLELGKENLVFALLNEMKKNGLPVRQHYFWPLILANAKKPTDAGIINVVLKMGEFDLIPSSETLRDYVIPNLKGKSNEIIAKLRQANVSVGHSASSLVHCLLLKNDIEEAAVIISGVSAYYRADILRRPLSNAYMKTKNLDSYITILRHIYESQDKNPSEEENQVVDKSTIVGSYILDLSTNSQFFAANIATVLAKLVEQGVSISTTTAEKVQDKLGEKMTDEISDLLGKLTSGELTPIPIVRKSPTYIPYTKMDIPQLERLILNLESKNSETKHLKRQLLNLYYRARDATKVEELLNNGLQLTGGICAQLVDLYAHHDNLEKALFYLDKLKEIQPDFVLDDSKIIKLSETFTKHDRFNEAIEILETLPRESKQNDFFPFSMLVWRYLNLLAEQGRVNDLERLFQTLTDKGYVTVNNNFLGPLIKVHLTNKDIDRALDKFEWSVQQYKCTPWKSELARQLIEAEDAEKLQRLTDLSTQVHGEINSLYDLVFSFVDCGRIRQARKILETPGLQNRPQRINQICERYQQEGQVKSLEGLKDATKDLNHIDRSDIYYQLLLSYIKQDDAGKALGLWTQMQEEDLQPTEDFMNRLGTFLKEKGEAVPFVIPRVVAAEVVDNSNKQQSEVRPHVQSFRQLLKAGNLDQAMRLSKSNEKFTTSDLSNLIEKLVQNDRLKEASNLALDMLNKNQNPLNRVLKFLLNKLAMVGDVESLEKFSSKLTLEMKKQVSYDNRICHAKLISGKAEEYLNELDKLIDNADDNNLNAIADQFPRGGAFGILDEHPELLEKFEKIAEKFAKKGIIAPQNVLWIHSFINGNHEKAAKIWKDYLEKAPRIMFHRIVKEARDTQNEELCHNLINHLKESKVTEGAIGNVYSCLLDILVGKENNEEVVRVFESAIKDVAVDHINRTAVLRVKGVYEKLGKSFSFPIPARNNKNATTSSSSSDEERKKQQVFK